MSNAPVPRSDNERGRVSVEGCLAGTGRGDNPYDSGIPDWTTLSPLCFPTLKFGMGSDHVPGMSRLKLPGSNSSPVLLYRAPRLHLDPVAVAQRFADLELQLYRPGLIPV